MKQAPLLDYLLFDLLSSCEDGVCPAQVDVGLSQVPEAFVVALVVVVLDKVAEGPLECAEQVVVLEEDAVLQALVSMLDLALGLGMVRGTADVIHALLFEPGGQIARDVGRSVIAEKPRSMGDRRSVTS